MINSPIIEVTGRKIISFEFHRFFFFSIVWVYTNKLKVCLFFRNTIHIRINKANISTNHFLWKISCFLFLLIIFSLVIYMRCTFQSKFWASRLKWDSWLLQHYETMNAFDVCRNVYIINKTHLLFNPFGKFITIGFVITLVSLFKIHRLFFRYIILLERVSNTEDSFLIRQKFHVRIIEIFLVITIFR